MSRTPELTAVERAQLDAFEAAAYAEDALRERIAVAICGARSNVPWEDQAGWQQRHYRAMADAALAVVRTPVDGAA